MASGTPESRRDPFLFVFPTAILALSLPAMVESYDAQGPLEWSLWILLGGSLAFSEAFPFFVPARMPREIWLKIAAVTLALIAGYLTALSMIPKVRQDRGSTASLLIPFALILGSAWYYRVVWSVLTVARGLVSKSAWGPRAALCLGTLYSIALALCVVALWETMQTNNLIKSIAKMDANETTQCFEHSRYKDDRWVLNALVCNPNLSTDALVQVAHRRDRSLERYGKPSLVSASCNSRGYAVQCLVAHHIHSDESVLSEMWRHGDVSIESAVIENPRTPASLVERMYPRLMGHYRAYMRRLRQRDQTHHDIDNNLRDEIKQAGNLDWQDNDDYSCPYPLPESYGPGFSRPGSG